MKNIEFYRFLISLAKDLNRFYKKNLNKPFKAINKGKGSNYDPVTIADKKFEKFIRSKNNKKYPSHSIVGEEFGKKKTKSDYSWVIDPIDGTRSFVIGSPTWSNLISLNYKQLPVMGLVNFPVLNKFYLNRTDKIAHVFENGKKRRLKVNGSAKIKGVKLTAAFHGYLSFSQQAKISQILKLNHFPTSDALSYMQVADGTLDVAIQCGNHIWDIHPSIPIIKAAGGVVTNWRNENIIKRDNALVSANKLVHKKILKLLSPLKKI